MFFFKEGCLTIYMIIVHIHVFTFMSIWMNDLTVCRRNCHSTENGVWHQWSQISMHTCPICVVFYFIFYFIFFLIHSTKDDVLLFHHGCKCNITTGATIWFLWGVGGGRLPQKQTYFHDFHMINKFCMWSANTFFHDRSQCKSIK